MKVKFLGIIWDLKPIIATLWGVVLVVVSLLSFAAFVEQWYTLAILGTLFNWFLVYVAATLRKNGIFGGQDEKT